MNENRPEFAYIDWLRGHVASHRAVSIGIGDDAASIRIDPPGNALVAADMLMEGVDFHLSEWSPEAIGRKALAVNLSDLAAMGGKPVAAIVSVAFPKSSGFQFAQRFHRGLQSLAEEFDVAIAGGDTNSWNGPLVINVTILGVPTGRGPVQRNGARPGDRIFVTGELGGSIAGRHMTFTPRVIEGMTLNQTVNLHAMIDVSDGLAADLHHILDESRVGAILYEESIPISNAARSLANDCSPLDRALSDGEDFELLFTVARDEGERLLAHSPIETPLSHIGEIVADRCCVIVGRDGQRRDLPPRGWTHEF